MKTQLHSSVRQSAERGAAAPHSTAKAPPAWLITASMLAFAIVTIVLVLTGQ